MITKNTIKTKIPSHRNVGCEGILYYGINFINENALITYLIRNIIESIVLNGENMNGRKRKKLNK